MTKKSKIRIAAGALALMVAGGVIWAQQRGGGFGPFGAHHGRMVEFLSGYLDLTPAQEAQAKAIAEATRQAGEASAQQLRQSAEQAHAAILAGKPEAELRQIANGAGQPAANLAFLAMRGMSQFYTLLTQPQREKLNKLHERMKSRREQRGGAMHGPPGL